MADLRLVDRLKRLGFPSETALRLFSIVLWLQTVENMPDFLSVILSMEDAVFSTVIDEVASLLGFLFGKQPTDPATSLCLSNLQALVANRDGSISIIDLLKEREIVRASVDATYKKLLSKKKGKAKEAGVGANSKAGRSSSQGHRHNQTLTRPSFPTPVPVGQSSRPQLNHAAPPFVPVTSVNRGPEEERSLYLTFSKDHPLSAPEIGKFFEDLCSNIGRERQKAREVVETVFVEEDQSRPLFGKVVFCNSYLPKFFLAGKKKVKFIVDGKPLWGKEFLPKFVRNNPRRRVDGGERSQVLRGPRGLNGVRGSGDCPSSGGHFDGGSHYFVRPKIGGIGVVAPPFWPVGPFQVPLGTQLVGPLHGGGAGIIWAGPSYGGYHYHQGVWPGVSYATGGAGEFTNGRRPSDHSTGMGGLRGSYPGGGGHGYMVGGEDIGKQL